MDVPISQKVLNVMIPHNVTFEDLSRSWIVYMWSLSVLNICTDVSYYGVPSIFWTPVRIFFCGRSISGNDGFLKSSFFKSSLPIFNTLFDKWNPFFWSSWVDVVYDLLFRKYNFTLSISNRIGWIKSPSRNKSFAIGLMFITTIISLGLLKNIQLSDHSDAVAMAFQEAE